MSEEEKEAIESVKSMFGDITIEKLIKDKIYNITICSLGILDILRVIAIVDKQQEEIEVLKEDLDKKVKALDIAMSNPDYISKDKIKEIFQFYIERDSLFNDDAHKMTVIRLKDVLQDLLEEN